MTKDSTNRNFQLFAKPVGARCNMGCTYCYYLDNKMSMQSASVMDSDLLVKYISQHFEATTDDTVFFSWHGGEPAMAGLDFYREAVDLQNKFNHQDRRVINGIQTNGTLLTEEWTDFFAENGFVVGLSVDGPEELHNKHRLFSSGRGSFDDVMKGWKLLTDNNITYEILCTLNNTNSARPGEVYEFFRSMEVKYITFLPVVERDNNGILASWSVEPEIFGDFLIQVFDTWKSTDIGRIEIQIIEEAMRTALNTEHSLCILREECGGVPVIEKDGNVYCCDHYVNSENLIGNIASSSLSALIDSKKLKNFGRFKRSSLPDKCLNCPVLDMCNGGCPKNRFIELPGEANKINYLCPGYLKFFSHVKPFTEMVAGLSKIK